MTKSRKMDGEKRPESREEKLSRLRQELEALASRQKGMQDMCAKYNPKPIYQMTPKEAMEFATRQAVEASRSIKMTVDEMQEYASAVYMSIIHMNKADKRHIDHMRYLAECEAADKETAKLKKQEAMNKNKPKIVIY